MTSKTKKTVKNVPDTASVNLPGGDSVPIVEDQTLEDAMMMLVVAFRADFSGSWLLDGIGNAAHRLAERQAQDIGETSGKLASYEDERVGDTQRPGAHLQPEITAAQQERLEDRLQRSTDDEATARCVVAIVKKLQLEIFDKEWTPAAWEKRGPRVTQLDKRRAELLARVKQS